MATIEFDGQQIPAPELGFASEATLRRLAGMSGGTAGSIGSLGTKSNTTAKSLDDLRRKTEALEDKFPKVTTGFDLLGSAITGTAGLLKGVMNATGKFTDLNPVVDFTTDKLQGLASMVPFVGGFLGSLADASGELIKFKLEIADLTLETFQGLNELGIQFNKGAGDTDDFIQEVLRAQVSLGAFQQVISENLEGIVAFGGATDKGARKFLAQLDGLTNPASEAGMQLRAMGLSSEDIAETFGNFISDNRFNAQMMNLSEQQLNDALIQRVKNERLITELTGLDVKEQRARINQSVQEAGLQAALMDMNAEAAAQTMNFTAMLDGPIKDAFIGLTTPFGIINEESLKLMAFVPNLQSGLTSIQQRLEDGSLTAAEAQAELNQILEQNATNEQVRNLLTIDAARGTSEFTSFLGDAFLKGRLFTNQLDLINKSTGQNFKTQDEAAEYFLKQINVSVDEFKSAMDAVGMLSEEQQEELRRRIEAGEDIGDFAGLSRSTGNTIAAMAAIQDEFFSLSQAKIIGTFAGDLDGFVELLGKSYDKLGNIFNLDDIEQVKVAADKVYVMTGPGKAIEIQDFANEIGIPSEISGVGENYMGGPNMSGQLSMVGEKGPELVKFGGSNEVVNNATTQDIMGAANAVVNNLGANNSNYPKQTLDVLTAMAKDQADTKRLLMRILPKAMTGNGYF